MRAKVSLVKTYRVSWLKPKEHHLKISALEICLVVTMSSMNADPKLLCFQDTIISAKVFRFLYLYWHYQYFKKIGSLC